MSRTHPAKSSKTAHPAAGPAPAEQAGRSEAAAPRSGDAGRPPSSRRRLFVRLWALVGGVALGEVVWVTGSFLKPRASRADASSLFVAGPLDRFAPDSVTAFPLGRFYLVRLKDGGFLALHRECTHLGCTVPWDTTQGRFVCPCHASSFDITGQVINAPAPRPLDYFAVRVENGIVKVDTRRRLSRTGFDPSQVTVA